MLIDIPGSKEITDSLREELGAPSDAQINFQVMETVVDGEMYYVCFSGGKMEEGEIAFTGVDKCRVAFTTIGLGAFETLRLLPTGDDTIFIQQLRVGKIPMQEKVVGMLKRHPPGSKVCFVGDLAGELDGKMGVSFNIQEVKPYQAS